MARQTDKKQNRKKKRKEEATKPKAKSNKPRRHRFGFRSLRKIKTEQKESGSRTAWRRGAFAKRLRTLTNPGYPLMFGKGSIDLIQQFVENKVVETLSYSQDLAVRNKRQTPYAKDFWFVAALNK